MNNRTNNGQNSGETRRRRHETTPTATSGAPGTGIEVRRFDFERKPRCLGATILGAVKAYLIKQGIASDRIAAVGYGEEKPVASNDTPEGRQKNRRTEVQILSE